MHSLHPFFCLSALFFRNLPGWANLYPTDRNMSKYAAILIPGQNLTFPWPLHCQFLNPGFKPPLGERKGCLAFVTYPLNHVFFLRLHLMIISFPGMWPRQRLYVIAVTPLRRMFCFLSPMHLLHCESHGLGLAHVFLVEFRVVGGKCL